MFSDPPRDRTFVAMFGSLFGLLPLLIRLPTLPLLCARMSCWRCERSFGDLCTPRRLNGRVDSEASCVSRRHLFRPF